MRATISDDELQREPLRLWPGLLAATTVFLGWFVVPLLVADAIPIAVLAGLIGSLAVVVWWLFLSRVPWIERIGGVVGLIVALVVTQRLVHVSIATGAMGMLFPIYGIPTVAVAFVAGAVASRNLSAGARRATMTAAVLAACLGWAVVRTNGVSGSFNWDFAWRWSATAEDRLLARAAETSMGLPSAAARAASMDTGPGWPGFRGPNRDGVVRGVRIATDWTASPPVELWRRPVGPGWSSFAVRGDLMYTQEQRGDDEAVSAYSVATGEPVWRHLDATRFWEAMAGAGPRGTPVIHGDHVYAFGATGILNALDAADGSVVWSRDAAADTGVNLPGWGFASSPLVVDDMVVVAVAGKLAAYDLDTGTPRWSGPDGSEGYSSPHLLTIDGVRQLLLMNGSAVTSVAPVDGRLLWDHPWPGFHSLQPAMTADGDLLVSVSSEAAGIGIRRLTLTHGPDGWTPQERWTSRGLKPYFNDFAVHEGHAYGFDGRILSCIDLATGERAWKGGRYGNGQLILLADQDVLLVLSEGGELALVSATAAEFRELARFPAIEGKTWNHPVLVGDVLLVRNDREMAAFRLTLADGVDTPDR